MEYFLHGVRLWQRGRVFGDGVVRGSLRLKNTTAREATPHGLLESRLLAVRKALEKHFRESDGSTGYENGRCGRISTAPDGKPTGVVNEPIN